MQTQVNSKLEYKTNSKSAIIFVVIRWWTAGWQPCQGSCFRNLIGYRKRTVLCAIEQPNELDDSLELIGVPEVQCVQQPRPIAVEPCELDCAHSISTEINAYWIAEEWSNVKYNNNFYLKTIVY